MEELKLFKSESASQQNITNGTHRSLKIEAEGDPRKGAVKPKIRLMGRWLERAGFKPGQRVSINLLAPGIVELRSEDRVQ